MSRTQKHYSRARTSVLRRLHEEFIRKSRAFKRKVCRELKIDPEKEIVNKTKNIEFSDYWNHD